MHTYIDFQIQFDGIAALPLTAGAGTFSRTGIPRTEEKGYFTVSFYDSAALDNRVTPTTGTVQIVGSTDEQMIWKTVSDGSFNASAVYDEALAIPYAEGPMSNIQVRFLDVDVATHARVYVSKY